MITDHFTRYAAEYVTLKKTAPIVAKVLWENFFSELWVTRENLNRSRKELCEFSVKELCELAGVQKLKTIPTIQKQMDYVSALIRC